MGRVNLGPQISDFESDHLLFKPDGTWVAVQSYFDSGNFVGDFVNLDALLDYGFPVTAIDITNEVIYETMGSKDGSAYGTIRIRCKDSATCLVVDRTFYVCKFPFRFQKYAFITGMTSFGENHAECDGGPEVFAVGGIKDSRRRTREEKEQIAQFLRASAEKSAERQKEKEKEKDKAQKGVSKIPKILPQQ